MIALDAGVLIALERRSAAAQELLDAVSEDDVDVLVSAMVVAEVWREPPSVLIACALLGCRVEPVVPRSRGSPAPWPGRRVWGLPTRSSRPAPRGPESRS